MSNLRELTVLIVPEGWKRPGGQGRRRFTVKSQRDFQNAIRAAWTDKYGDAEVLQGPIRMMLMFIMPRPKAMMWKRKPMPSVPHTKAPDLSNLIKNVEDALNRLAYRDDSQVYDLQAITMIAAGGEQPMINIVITEVD